MPLLVGPTLALLLVFAVAGEQQQAAECNTPHCRAVALQRLCLRHTATFGEGGGSRDLDVAAQQHFDAYAKDRCNQSSDNWVLFTADDHHQIAEDIVRAVGIKETDFVFDWGSGCGTKLAYLEQRFAVTAGFGLELSATSVTYANRRLARSRFCQADGRDLRWIPDAVFDHTISYGAVYVLMRPEWKLLAQKTKKDRGGARRPVMTVPDPYAPVVCDVMIELLRVTKPGGFVLVSAFLGTPSRKYFQDYCAPRMLKACGGQRVPVKITDQFLFHRKRIFKYFHPGSRIDTYSVEMVAPPVPCRLPRG